MAALIWRRFSAAVILPRGDTEPTAARAQRRLAAVNEQRWLLKLDGEHANLSTSDQALELDEQLNEARAARVRHL